MASHEPPTTRLMAAPAPFSSSSSSSPQCTLDHESGSGSGSPPAELEQFLDQVKGCHLYPLFITTSMAFLWALVALTAISPAFLAGPCAGPNCTFANVQSEFKIKHGLMDPAELCTSAYFFGNLVIGQLFATMADRFGRRPVVLASLFWSGASGLGAALAPTYELLILARFLQGSIFTPLTTVNWVLCNESMPVKSHGFVSAMFGFFWVLGYCMLAPMSVVFNTWRSLQVATSVPSFFVGFILYFTLPESLAFSVERQNRAEVEKWVTNYEKVSQVRLNHDLDRIMNVTECVGEKLSFRQIFHRIRTQKKILMYTGIETIIWLVDFMAYCALSLTSTSVGSSDPLLSFVFSGFIELPAYLLVPVALKLFNRKSMVMGCHGGGALALVTIFFLADNSHMMHLPLWLVAKFFIASCYILCFICGSELFPTFCRSFCMGICATFCNLGAIMSPHVFLFDAIYPQVTFIFLATIFTLVMVLVTFLPETETSLVDEE